MTALLEIKQNIKRFYGEYEVYILPVLKFALAFVYFLWINSNMGYMKQLDNIFVILVLATGVCYFTCIRDDVHRICHDDRSLLCGGTGSGRILCWY